MESTLLCTLALSIYWHWSKDYNNLCNKLAFFSDNANASSNTDANASSDANTDTKANTNTDTKADSYAATTGGTDTASSPSANTCCAAYSYNNSSSCNAN